MKEIEELLPRVQADDLNEIIGKFSFLINDAVNFGTHLIKWDADKKREGDEHLPPVLFLRNIIELLDSISILIKNSSIDPCKPLLRSLLENTFGLLYMLEKDTDQRSLSYFVWHTHKNLKFYEKLNSSTQSGKQFKKELEKDKLLPSHDDFFDKPVLSVAKKNAEDLLQLPKYRPIEIEYQNKSATKKNPSWYSLFNGPDNIELLAKYLNLHASYEILYRGFSGNVHATNIFQKKIVPNADGSIAIVQIRYPGDAQSVTQNTLNIALIAYKSYLDSRLPERIQDYQNWYMEFRKPYIKLSEGNYINMVD